MERTKSDELRTVTCGSAAPVLLAQIIEQRKAVFELFEVLVHGAVLAPEARIAEARQRSQARMVGARTNLLETQGPENLQNWSQPRQRSRFRVIARCQLMSDAGKCLVQEGSRRGRVQAASPAAERGRIGQAIGIFERRGRLFPGAMVHKVSPQGPSASYEAVVRVRGREGRQKRERLPATRAVSATDLNPVVMLIVSLLATASVADDRIALTNGAASQDDVGALFGPTRFELVRWGRKWDKENRRSSGLCSGVDLPRSEPEAEPLLLKRKIPTEREYRFSAMAFGEVVQKIGRLSANTM